MYRHDCNGLTVVFMNAEGDTGSIKYLSKVKHLDFISANKMIDNHYNKACKMANVAGREIPSKLIV